MYWQCCLFPDQESVMNQDELAYLQAYEAENQAFWDAVDSIEDAVWNQKLEDLEHKSDWKPSEVMRKECVKGYHPLMH